MFILFASQFNNKIKEIIGNYYYILKQFKNKIEM